MKKRLLIAGPVAAIASLVLPGVAGAAEATPILETPEASINAMWVIVAGPYCASQAPALQTGESRLRDLLQPSKHSAPARSYLGGDAPLAEAPVPAGVSPLTSTDSA